MSAILRATLYPFRYTRLLSTKVGVPFGVRQGTEEQKTDREEGSNVQQKGSGASLDPFESVPLRKLAEYLGETFSPKLEDIQQQEKERVKPKRYKEILEPPQIPHFLPLARWAAQSERIKETLVVDEKRTQRVRLSWYHPDDTMVPRGWFTKGLLEDLKHYKPFGKRKE